MPVVVAVQGPSGSGKTTLIERLLPRLSARGLKIGVVKHTHDGFALDRTGKDSERFWGAGAQVVLAAGPQELFLRQRAVGSSLSVLLDLLPRELDCVLIEGFAETAGMVDGPLLVRVEVSRRGVRLNGRLIASDAAVGAVEEAVVDCLQERPSGSGAWEGR